MKYLGQEIDDNKYYFLINTDAHMSGGKAGAQCSNVAVQLPKAKLRGCIDPCTINLGAPEYYMYFLLKKFYRKWHMKWTIDAGLTEWTIGTLTCVGFKLSTNPKLKEEQLSYVRMLSYFTSDGDKLVKGKGLYKPRA